MRLSTMLVVSIPELLASRDAHFSFTETSPGSELYFMTSAVIDLNSSKGFKLNVKLVGTDVGRGTSEIPTYQWRITRIGDVVTSTKEVSMPGWTKDISKSNKRDYSLSWRKCAKG